MATTDLFSDPVFKDGAFTSNDPKVRTYALQKTMAAIDLGVEVGASVFVFWVGREGTETDVSKNPITGIQRYREAMNMIKKIKKWGNSLAIRIPSPFAAEIGLEEDSPVS